MGELSLEETGTARQRTVTWTDPLVGAALARDLSGLEYCARSPMDALRVRRSPRCSG